MARNHPALRWTVVVTAALLLHGAALWALQIGLMRQTADAAPVPVAAVIEMMVNRAVPAPEHAAMSVVAHPIVRSAARPAKTQVEAKPLHKPLLAAALPHPRVVPVQPLLSSVQPVPRQKATPESTVQIASETASALPVQPASNTSDDAAQAGGMSAAVADAAGASAQEQKSVSPPSANAACSGNSKPDYPPMSRLRNESGTVELYVRIGADGRVQDVRIKQSSGYDRLNDAALSTVSRWRCRPGTRGGVPEAGRYTLSVPFILE